ncbi:MAG: hypothetical protein HZB59_01890 [Ignavibacteriales bacterium]|nr:hypothetical protein [Ignavibacteriales bacterium]
MDTLLVLMEIIALGALTVLCVYLITVFIRVKSILQIIESETKTVAAKAIPVLNNIEIITEKIKNVTENIDEQVVLVKSSINSIKEIADNIVNLERRVQERIEEPVMETVGTLAAVVTGIRAFITRLRA